MVYKSTRIGVVVVTIILIAIMIFPLCLTGCSKEDPYSQAVTATISTCKISNHKDKTKQYYSISYSYEWDGKKYTGNYHEATQNYNKGNQITVYIDPQKPSRSTLK